MANNQAQKQPDGQNRDYYDIRNARAVRASDNDNDPRAANFVPERRPEPPEADNDNDREDLLKDELVRRAKTEVLRYGTRKPRRPGKAYKGLTKKIVGKAASLRKAGAASAIVEALSMPYAFQVFFALICFIGFAALGGIDQSSLLGAVDQALFGTGSEFSAALYLIGTVGALLCGGIIAAVTTPVLKLFGSHPFGGGSILVLAVCTGLHLVPILNLFPIMGIWCLFVLFAK